MNDERDIVFAKENGFEDKEDIYKDWMDRWNPEFVDFIWNNTDYDGIIHSEMEIRYKDNPPNGLGVRLEVLDSAFKKTLEYTSREECMTRPEYKAAHDKAMKVLLSEIEIFKNKNPSDDEITKGVMNTLRGSWTFGHSNRDYALGVHTLYMSEVYKLLKDEFSKADWDKIDREIERIRKIDND